MKKSLIFALAAIFAITACKGTGKNVSPAYQNDTEMIGVLINNGLIDPVDLSKLIAVNGDDGEILKTILDYNSNPDKFAGNNGEAVGKDALKKKLLLLTYNLE
jgi:hypothetical protein